MSIKEQIIQELTTKNILDCQIMRDGDFWGDLSDEEKLEVNNAIFENIMRNSEGWTIKQVRTVNFYMGKGLWYERLGIEWLGKVWGCSRGYYQMDEILLVHELAQLKWSEEGILVYDYTRTQPFDSFTPEQQTELRRLLASTIAELLDSQLGEPIKPPHYFSFPPLCPTLGILVILVLFIISRWYRKVNKKLDKNKSFSYGKSC